jgi:GNAT superfamily N-acetyltransferase
VSITVSDARVEDAQGLAELFCEMDDFYGEAGSETQEEKIRHIEAVLFAPQPLAYALVAHSETRIAGFATYSFLWPAERTTVSLYLKELYVSQAHRRSGIGASLMNAIFSKALDKDASRVEWTTDKSNNLAKKFYEELQAPLLRSKIIYRVDGEAFSRFAPQ